MPHQCTSCGYLFEDGSKAMLSGCPDCGGNTFQFHADGAPIPDVPDEEPPEPEGGTVGDTVGRATNAVRGLVNRGDQPAGAPDHSDDLEDPVDATDLRDGDNDRDGPADPTDAGSARPGESGSPAATGADAASADATSVDATSVDAASGDAASADAASGAGDVVGAGGSDEPPESGRDADVEHAPWPGEDPDDGEAGAAPDAAEAGAAPDAAEGSALAGDDEGIIDADAREGNTAEDAAQASARTEFVGPDELPGSEDGAADAGETGDAPTGPPGGPPSNGRVIREPTGEQPSLDELRQELNDQFESIKIVNPGEYELNLMELYNREEYVVALQENGRYVIQMPENWMRNRDED